MKNLKKLRELINLSVEYDATNLEPTEYDCDIELEVNGKKWSAYGCSVSHRDLLFFCEQGVCTYFVDTYGFDHTIELFDWEDYAEIPTRNRYAEFLTNLAKGLQS